MILFLTLHWSYCADPKIEADALGLRKLIARVDTNCPYRGEEDIRAIPDPTFAGIEHLPIRPRVKTAPIIERP
ncbi:MAG: hypothetical protein ACYS21_09660 [Planctomycetota bacterium]|jgi:hypothetical protein